MQVRRHFERVLWERFDDVEAEEIFDGLDEFLGELADAEGFLDIPVERLIARLTDKYVPEPDEDETAKAPKAAAPKDEPREAAPPPPVARVAPFEADWGNPPPAPDPATAALPSPSG